MNDFYKNTQDIRMIKFQLPLKFSINIHSPQPSIGSHNHNFLEFAYILDGQISQELNGVRTVLKEGDFMLIAKNAVHSFTRLKNCDCTVINCLFYPSFLDKSLPDSASVDELFASNAIGFTNKTRDFLPSNHVYSDTTGKIRKLILDMKDEYNQMLFGYERQLKLYLTSLLLLLIRELTPEDYLYPQSGIMHKITEYMFQHYDENITLNSVSEHFHFSPQYLCRKFKNETGFLFIDYLQRIRIAQSCRMLENSTMSITEISMAVGYQNLKHFETVFKKHVMQSPREYRKFKRIRRP